MEINPDAKVKHNIKIGLEGKILRREKILGGKITDVTDYQDYNPEGIKVQIDDCYYGNLIDFEDEEELTIDELKKLIENHEQAKFEMKSSYQYDVNESKEGEPVKNDVLKEKIVKEIISFMNTDGGTLCIGVDNNKNILGLENDFKLLSIYEKDMDKDLLIDKLKGEILDQVFKFTKDQIIYSLFHPWQNFVLEENKHVLVIHIKKSHKPIFFKKDFRCLKCNATHKAVKGKVDDERDRNWTTWTRNEHGIKQITFDAFFEHWKLRNQDQS